MWLGELRTSTVSLRMRVRSLALLSGLRLQCCLKLLCKSQVQLRFGVAVDVAYAGSCSSDLTSSPGTPMCCRFGHKKDKKKKKKIREEINKIQIKKIEKISKKVSLANVFQRDWGTVI